MGGEYVKLTNNSMGEPTYFYRVSFFMTTFKEDQSFSHSEEFQPEGDSVEDLFESRNKAFKYYNEIQQGVNTGTATFFKPFAGFKDFKEGQNAAFSMEIDFIEYYNEEEEVGYTIVGGVDDEEIKDSLDTEKLVYKSKGGLIAEDGKFYVL